MDDQGTREERREQMAAEQTTTAAPEQPTPSATTGVGDAGPVASAPRMSLRGSLRDIGWSLIINGAVPLVVYNVLKGQGASDLTALGAAAVVPAIDGIVTVVRRHRIDLISALALAGIAVSTVAILIGGDPRLLLIRESFLTGALGVACFVSFLLPRPLMFYFGRYFSTGDDPAKVARYNVLWQYAYFRHVNRVVTVVWGATYLGEFALRVFMVYNLSINQVLALSPLVFNGISIAVILWTFAYARHAWRRGTEMEREATPAMPRSA